jgi:RHH-type transcriptional regulator, rel operon repressor / antitoxin RelB
MTETGTFTIRVEQEYLDRLNALAQRTGRSKDLLAAEALAAYLAVQEWQVEAIREAVEAADSGATPVEHATVAAWLRSWGSEDELPRPR